MTQDFSNLGINPSTKPNAAALWAMIMGVTALVLSVIVVGGAVGLFAVVLGIIGVTKPGRKGMAVTGLVTGGVSLLLTCVALVFWAGVFLFASSHESRASVPLSGPEVAELQAEMQADQFVEDGRAKVAGGDYAGAIAAYDRAIELVPDDASKYNGRGYAKRLADDLDGAIADFNRAMQLDPDYAQPHNQRGIVRYLQRDFEAAASDLQRGCELDEPRHNPDQDYPRLFLWVVRARQGGIDAANEDLTAYIDERRKLVPNKWSVKVADFLLGRMPEAEFIDAADSPDPVNKQGQTCEAWFYAGMKRLIAGDKTTAAEDFRKCLATEKKSFVEYRFAEAELKSLANERPVPLP